MKTSFLFLCLTAFIQLGFAQKNNAIQLSQWKIANSKDIHLSDKQIALQNNSDEAWTSATVPTTVFNALVIAGKYTDIYKGKNMEKIDRKPFKTPWWYRTEFEISDNEAVHLLKIEGINYRADIWLNGTKIADHKELVNPFRQFEYRIDSHIKHRGKNILAIKVYPPQAGDFTIGFVDWNPAPPDNNMGIYRNVSIISNNGVGIKEPYIEAVFKNHNYNETDLIFTTELKNYTDKATEGRLKINIGNSDIDYPVKLKAGEQKKIVLTSKDFKQLHIDNPKLWWTHTLGTPHLYRAKVQFTAQDQIIDQYTFDFGIREVEDFFTPEGHRGFKLNGHKILIRGGGWVDNMMLDDTPDYIKAQLEYVKDMHLNTIRLEGFWGKDHTIYDLCDQMGILIMVGWSCQWEWEDYLGKPADETYGGIQSPQDIELISKAWRDQVVWLRNHPSIFTWFSGSDCIPHPDLEKNYFDIFKKYDSTRIYLASAKEWTSLAGPSGVKMRGPYAYVPPVYWYKDTLFGGAFGFNTETGPGAQVPPLESIKKMIPEKDLWPINDVWEYHCGRKQFNTLYRFTTALNKRYGEPKNVADFAFKAQVLNYELMRPMFEAFSANRYKATGVIQWMLNSAWPEMYWQLYDTYLLPNGAYYGAKVAGRPLHAIYNYNNHAVYLVNDRISDKNDTRIVIKVFDVHAKLQFQKSLRKTAPGNTSVKLMDLPDFNAIEKVYFLDIRVFDKNNKLIDTNFYWLSNKKDVLDYKAEVPGWYYHTPSKSYADFTDLNRLEKVKLHHTILERSDSKYHYFDVTLDNRTDKIAFFTELKLINPKTGARILPVIWSDNYVSLLPGESRTFTARFDKSQLENIKPEFTIQGWNTTLKP